MLGVAALQLLAHLEIGGLPETGEILRKLNGLETWREQLQQQRLPAIINSWRLSHSEAFLQTNTEDGSLGSLTIVDADMTARWNHDVGGCEAVYLLLLLVWNLCPEYFREIELPEFGSARLELSALVQIEGQPFAGCLHQVRCGQIGQLHFRVPLSYLRHPPLQPLNVFVPIQHAESFLPDGGAEYMDNLLFVGILEWFAIYHQGSDASLSLHPDYSRLTVPRDVVELVGREVDDVYGSREKHPACLS